MQDLPSLPARSTNTHKISVFTNAYEIRTERLPQKYYLYTPTNSSAQNTLALIKQHMKQNKQHPDSFYHQIGFICFFKEGLLGNTDLTDSHTLRLNEGQQNDRVETITMKKQRDIELKELVSDQKGIKFMRTTLQTSLDRITSKKDLKVSLHKYKQFVFEDLKQISLRFFSLNSKIMMSTDVAHKVQEHCSILDYISRYSAAETAGLLRGARLIKNYGNRQQSYLLSIDCAKNPTQKMRSQSEQTFEQYFLNKYNIQVRDLSQPLILATKANQQKNKQTSRQSEYLIPELVSVAGRSYMPEYPLNLQNQLDKLKRMLPQEKETCVSEMIQELAAEDIIKKSAISLGASQLTAPTILIKNSEIKPEDGVFDFQNSILHSSQLRIWAVAYSVGSTGTEKTQAEIFINYIRALSVTYGLNITSNPSFVEIKGSGGKEWQQGLEQNLKYFKTKGKLQMVVLFLKQEEEKHYFPLKELLQGRARCPSQVVCKKKLAAQKCRKPYIIVKDIMIQIMTKIGAVPWDVKRQPSAITSSLFMCAGLTVTSNEHGISYALVGSTGKQQNMVYSNYKKSLNTWQELKTELQIELMLWAKAFVVRYRVPPQTIILYCQFLGRSVSLQQNKAVREVFFGLAAKISTKIKMQSYAPKMACVNVIKHPQIEFYSREMMANDFVLKNVPSGTVVYQQVEAPRAYNFYMCSETSLVSAVKPVKYEVVCRGQGMEVGDLAQFIFECCFCYFGFKGAFSIPGMLQNSRKLSGLIAGMRDCRGGMGGNMSELAYYL